jgi:guanine nucleotide-binding protein subunit alpha
MLEEDRRKIRIECRVLVMGTDDSGKEAIMNQVKTAHQNGFTVEECQAYRNRICNKIIEDMHICINTIVDLQSESLQDVEVNKHARIILEHSPPIQEIPQGLADAIESIWRANKDSFCERQSEISAKLVPL